MQGVFQESVVESVLAKVYGALQRCQHCGAQPTRKIMVSVSAENEDRYRYTCEKCLPVYLTHGISGEYLEDDRRFIIQRSTSDRVKNIDGKNRKKSKRREKLMRQ